MRWRLLHVIRTLRPETGGLVEAVNNLSVALHALGHAVTTLSLDPADARANRPDTVVVGRTSHGYGRAPEYVRWLREHRSEFDAVIVHGLWQQQSFGAWQALRGTGTPYFVFCHGMLDPWFKRTYPLKHLKKWLYWPWADYRALRDAAGVCYTSEEERRAARESFGLYRARELIIPLGVAEPPGEAEAQREIFLGRHPALRDRPFLLFLGRVHPKKGLEPLFNAYAAVLARRADAPALVVAGPATEEAYRERLKAQAARLGLGDALQWVGMIAGEEKWGALRACEAFVLLSHQENFGMATVEALACGKPVLISRRINIWREIVADGAGWAGPDNAAGAAEVLAQWETTPADRRATMGRAARECFQRRFSAASAAQRCIETMAAAVTHPPPLATAGSALPPAAAALAGSQGDGASAASSTREQV